MNNPERSQREIATVGNNLTYAYNLACRLLETFRVDRFYDSYDMSQNIDRVKLKKVNIVLDKMKKEETTEFKVYGQVAELVVLEGIKAGWLGDNFEVWKSSDVDDVLSGVDLVAEAPAAKDGKENLAAFNLGFDITTSVKSFGEKVDKTKIFLQSFRRFKELYYYTPQYKRKNGVIGIPSFPIYIPRDYIKNNYLDSLTDNEESSIIKPGDFYQIFLLKQIIEQAVRYRSILENKKDRMSVLSIGELDRIIEYFGKMLEDVSYDIKDGDSLLQARDVFYGELDHYYGEI